MKIGISGVSLPNHTNHGWLHSTVCKAPVFGRRTDPVLCSACS